MPLQAIQKLNDLYANQHDAGALRRLLTELRPLFAVIPKAKTAKIVRTIIETIAKVPNSTQLQVRGPNIKPGCKSTPGCGQHKLSHIVVACGRMLRTDLSSTPFAAHRVSACLCACARTEHRVREPHFLTGLPCGGPKLRGGALCACASAAGRALEEQAEGGVCRCRAPADQRR